MPKRQANRQKTPLRPGHCSAAKQARQRMLTNATWLHMMLAYWNDDVVDVDELATAVNLAASISQDADALRELLALRREALVRGGAR